MFQQQARIERYETHKAIHECKLEEGKSVATHVFEMIGYLKAIERLGFPNSQELATYIILHFLHGGFNQFRLNFNMNGVSRTFAKLHGMLMTGE